MDEVRGERRRRGAYSEKRRRRRKKGGEGVKKDRRRKRRVLALGFSATCCKITISTDCLSKSYSLIIMISFIKICKREAEKLEKPYIHTLRKLFHLRETLLFSFSVVCI